MATKRVTFVDACVLIAAATGNDQVAERAMRILDDPGRVFASSEFVRLEVLPKPLYHKREAEAAFYDAFFHEVTAWAKASEELTAHAFTEARRFGLSAMDAVHVAAALLINADEFVTGERRDKPLCKVSSLPMHTIRPIQD